jgi:hypothetical protein
MHYTTHQFEQRKCLHINDLSQYRFIINATVLTASN